VIHQPDEILAVMDEWNTKHHGASGLTERSDSHGWMLPFRGRGDSDVDGSSHQGVEAA